VADRSQHRQAAGLGQAREIGSGRLPWSEEIGRTLSCPSWDVGGTDTSKNSGNAPLCNLGLTYWLACFFLILSDEPFSRNVTPITEPLAGDVKVLVSGNAFFEGDGHMKKVLMDTLIGWVLAAGSW